MPDLKTPLLWILGIALLAALGTAGIERTQVAKAKESLALEKLDRSRETNDRNRAALAYSELQITKQAAHNEKQTEIANALDHETQLRKAGATRNVLLAASVRDTTAALAAALDRQDSAGRAAAGGGSGYRPDPLYGLLGEAGSLLAVGRELAAEGAEIVGRRDSEVAALVGVVSNDRALMVAPIAEASPAFDTSPPAASPVKLKSWFK